MKCPACAANVAADAWICPVCDHILDTSFLNDGEVHDEKTGRLSWEQTAQAFEPPKRAVALGNVDVSADEFGGGRRPVPDDAQNTPTFVYFAPGGSNRAVHPDAVPVVVRRNDRGPRSEYEDALLLCIDGQKSVREIQRASGLAAQDVVVNLLTLIDKGAIQIPDAAAIPTGSRRRRSRSGLRSNGSPSRTASPPKNSARNGQDFWGEDSSAGINAAGLIEDEVAIGRAAEDTPPLGARPPHFPSDVAAALEVAEGRRPAARTNRAPESGPVAMPQVTMPTHDQLVERLASQARLEPLVPPTAVPLHTPVRLEDGPDENDLPPVVPSDDLDPPDDDDVANTKELPIPLSPKFLTEVEPPAASSEHPGLPPPSALGRAIGGPERPTGGRTPGQTQNRHAPNNTPPAAALAPASPLQPAATPATGPGSAAAPATGPRSTAAPATSPRSTVTPAAAPKPVSRPSAPSRSPVPPARAVPTPREGVDSVRIVKAHKLYEQALKDKAEGNLVSARMNMKLALTFDPDNAEYTTAFDELNRDPKAKPRSISSLRSEARSYYEKATEAERHGDVDRAIAMLEKAIQSSRRAPFLNRLGVVLAMKKREFVRAQALIEEAIELVPTNTTYERNLQKVLSMAATAEVGGGNGGGRKGGLLRGLLGRKK